jgi:hypothetical protein
MTGRLCKRKLRQGQRPVMNSSCSEWTWTLENALDLTPCEAMPGHNPPLWQHWRSHFWRPSWPRFPLCIPRPEPGCSKARCHLTFLRTSRGSNVADMQRYTELCNRRISDPKAGSIPRLVWPGTPPSASVDRLDHPCAIRAATRPRNTSGCTWPAGMAAPTFSSMRLK